MLKANTNQEKSPENLVKGAAGAQEGDSNKPAEENETDTKENTAHSSEPVVGEEASREQTHGLNECHLSEDQTGSSEGKDNQSAIENESHQDVSNDSKEQNASCSKADDTCEKNIHNKESPTVVDTNDGNEYCGETDCSNENNGATSSTKESESVNDAEKTVCAAIPAEGNGLAGIPSEGKGVKNDVAIDSDKAVAVSEKPETRDSTEGLISQSEPDKVSADIEPPADNLTDAVSQPESLPANAVEGFLPDLASETQSNEFYEDPAPATSQIAHQMAESLQQNEADSYGYGPTNDSPALQQADSTDQLALSEEVPNRPVDDISDDQPEANLNGAAVFMMEDGSGPLLNDENIRGTESGLGPDLSVMDTQGVTLSIPEDESVINDTHMGDATLMAPDLETEGNPGTRVLLLQRQTDDGSLIQEYVEVPNVTDGEGNLIVYDEMGNQYIIPPSQADADPPMTEEVVTNETEIITSEDHLIADGLVLDDVELPVAQESPEDSTDHVVVERLQYQDVSFMPSHTRNDVQMSVEIGEEEEESDGEMGPDYISSEVNHVVVHHSEMLAHDLGHSDLSSVPFDEQPLDDLSTAPGGMSNPKKRKRSTTNANGKPAPARKRNKKVNKDGAALNMPMQNNFMGPVAASSGTLPFSHHRSVASGYRSSGMPVSPIRIPVPEMSEDSKDSMQQKSQSSGADMLCSPTLQAPQTPSSKKSHSPIQNKHPTMASLLFKGPTSGSPAVSPRSSSSSPFSGANMMSPNMPLSVSALQENIAPIPSVSSEDIAKSDGVIEQVCKMLPVTPPGWQPQYTTAQQGFPCVKTVTTTNAQESSHAKISESYQGMPVSRAFTASPNEPRPSSAVPNIPVASSAGPVVLDTAPILKIPMPERRCQGPVQGLPIRYPAPQSTMEQSKPLPPLADFHIPVQELSARNCDKGMYMHQPHMDQGPPVPSSTGALMQQTDSRHTIHRKSPIVIFPHEERLPPPYPGHSTANKPHIPQTHAHQISVPHTSMVMLQTSVVSSQTSVVSSQTSVVSSQTSPQTGVPHSLSNQKPQVEPPFQPQSNVPTSSVEMQTTIQALKQGVPTSVGYMHSPSYSVQSHQPMPKDIFPVRLPVNAVLPPGNVPPLMFPPGVLPPPHMMRGVPPGHAVPIELVRGQRPAFISPTGHILIPTDQLHLLQQGRFLPRQMLHGPPPLVRAPQQVPPQVANQPQQVANQQQPQQLTNQQPQQVAIQQPQQVAIQQPQQVVYQQQPQQVPMRLTTPHPVKPVEPIGLAPAPMTPTMPSPRTPEIAEDLQSMEAELVKAAHMAEVGQTAAGQAHQPDTRNHLESSVPKLSALSASVRQPPQAGTRPRPTKQIRQQQRAEMMQMKPNIVSSTAMPQRTDALPRRSDEEGNTLADKYMKDWQPTGRYKCKFCHYSSVTQNFLFRHWVMSHSGVKPYLCAFCNLKSPTKDGITRHQTAKHKELPREVLIDVEQEKLLVRKFRKVFTSLVPYRYHDYGEDEVPGDNDPSNADDPNYRDEISDNSSDVITMNSLGKSHENSKGTKETYIYSQKRMPGENSHSSNSEDGEQGHIRMAPLYNVNQLNKDSPADGQRQNETRSYPVLKKKIRESFEGEKEMGEDMRIKPGQFSWPNEEPTSRLSELAGIALSSQAPPPHSLEPNGTKRSKIEPHERRDSNPLGNTSLAVRPPVTIHPALQRPPIMLPPMDTLVRPQMLSHGMHGMVRGARPSFLARDVAMSLPPHFLPPENHANNMYDKDMLQSVMEKHKDAQTIVQLLVSQKRDLPPDLQLPGSAIGESMVPHFLPQPPPAHQPMRSVPMSSVAMVSPPISSMQARSHVVMSSASSDGAHVGLPTMAGMLKSPVITTTSTKIPDAGPYQDLPQLVPQNPYTTAGTLPPIKELRSSSNRSPVYSPGTVASSLAPSTLVPSTSYGSHISSVSSSSATAVLLAASAASAPEQVQTVETSSEALSSSVSSSPHVTSTSEDPVDGNANKTSRQDLQLRKGPNEVQTLNVAHSSPSPDQSQDSVKTTSSVNSTINEVSS